MAPPQPQTVDWLQTTAAWGAGAIGLAGSVALLRRRLSRDRTEITKDRVEGQFIELLLRERDKALEEARQEREERAAEARERQGDAEIIARLKAQNEHLMLELARLANELIAFKRRLIRLYPETREFLESHFRPDLEPQASSFPPIKDLP